jgi:hypothetical protein
VAVAFDSVGPSSAGQGTTGGTTLTWTHTIVAGGANTGVIVLAALDANPDGGFSMTATFGGVSMTSLGTVHSNATTQGFLQAWWLLNVATGANTVTVTPSGGTPDDMEGGSIAFTGAASHSTAATATGSSAAPSVTTATTTTGGLCVGGAAAGGNITSATAPSTSRFIINQRGLAGDDVGNAAGATSPSTGSTVTMAWASANVPWCAMAVEVSPPVVGFTPPYATPPPPVPPGWFPGAIQVSEPGNSPFVRKPQPEHSLVQPVVPRFITSVAGSGAQQYFTDQFNAPIIMRGDSIWGLAINAGVNGGGTTWQSDIDLYFSTRARQGFNAAIVGASVSSDVPGCPVNGFTWDGISPWVSGVIGNMNNAWWQRLDYCVTSAQAHGLTVILTPTNRWAITNTGAMLNGITLAQATTYGTALAGRYASAPNVIWLMGNDWDQSITGNDAILSNVAAAIRAAGDTHLMSIENLTEGDSRFLGLSGTAQTWGTGNAQFNWIYSYCGGYPEVQQSYTEANPLLVLYGDGDYEGDTAYAQTSRDYERNLHWWALSSGSRGTVYGNQPLHPWTAGASAGLTTNQFDNADIKVIWDTFSSWVGWNKLVPDLNSVFVTAGRGTALGLATSDTGLEYTGRTGGFGGATVNTYVTASKTQDGTLAVVYMPNGASAVTVNTALLAPGWFATWADPVSGAQTSATGGPTWSNSTTNAGGGADWVLVFQAPAVPSSPPASAVYMPPGWFPGAPGMPGGIPFQTWPQPGYAAFTAPAAQAGPPVYPLHGPVQARLPGPQRKGRVTGVSAGVRNQAGPPVTPLEGPVTARRPGPFVKGHTAGRSGVYAQAGPRLTPLRGPVAAVIRPLPPRGRAQGRAGTFTSTAPTSGPPVYPLHGPVRAYLPPPSRRGQVQHSAGTFAQAGPPVTPLRGPCRATRPSQLPGGRAQGRAGTFTFTGVLSGPPVYPLHGPVRCHPQPPPRGRCAGNRGTRSQTGPPVSPLRGPVAAFRPGPFRAGRCAWSRGTFAQAGPPFYPLRKPSRARIPTRPRGGRAAWNAGAPVFVVPFTVGALTASDVPTAALTAATASGGGSGGTLTATDQRTGGPS